MVLKMVALWQKRDSQPWFVHASNATTMAQKLFNIIVQVTAHVTFQFTFFHHFQDSSVKPVSRSQHSPSLSYPF